MSSSISSENSIISGVEFENGRGGEQQETEQISNLKNEVRELKNVVNVNDSELQEVKRQLDEVKNGQIAQSNQLGAMRFFITLPPANSEGEIVLPNGYKYTPDIEPFTENGAPYCHVFSIRRGPNAFSGYPPNFFDNHIKHINETKNPNEIIANLDFALDVNNPAPWPTVLVQLHAANLGLISKEQLERDGVPTLKEEKVDYGEKVVEYAMGNKHNLEARFKLRIYFEGGAKCHQQMTRFAACRTDIITFTGREFEQGKEEKEAEQICKLEAELQKVNAKNEKLEKEMEAMHKEGALKDQLDSKNLELQQMNEKMKKEMGEVKDQLNEVNQQVDQIAADYARTLPAPNSAGDIILINELQYTQEIEIFLRYGAAHFFLRYGAAICHRFFIWRGISDGGFVGYPTNFFNDLIKHYYQTKVPGKAVHHVGINLDNPAPWPMALLRPQAEEINVEEVEVKNVGKCVFYILRNKHNPGIAFKLFIYFEGNAICYQQMTRFLMVMSMEDVQSGAA